MSLLILDEAGMRRFDAICKTVASRGRGLSLQQIGDAAALARHLGFPDPKASRVEALRRRLGIEGEGVGHD